MKLDLAENLKNEPNHFYSKYQNVHTFDHKNDGGNVSSSSLKCPESILNTLYVLCRTSHVGKWNLKITREVKNHMRILPICDFFSPSRVIGNFHFPMCEVANIILKKLTKINLVFSVLQASLCSKIKANVLKNYCLYFFSTQL